MKKTAPLGLLVGLLVFSLTATLGQGTAAPTGQKTLAATMNIHVFPADGQPPDQQSKDEAECYNWAVQNTGTDPFELAKKSEQDKQQAAQAQAAAKDAGKGAAARGAVGGAAAGALIGEIASDDPGEGAAVGAALGAMRGRRKRKQAQSQATAQAEQQGQQSQAANQAAATDFKKAFTVCLEAKKYMAKF